MYKNLRFKYSLFTRKYNKFDLAVIEGRFIVKRFKILMLSLAIVFFSYNSPGFAQEESNTDSSSAQNPYSLSINNFTARKYILGPNDVISLSIYNVPEFKQENIRVQPDGKVMITPLGSVKVSGMTLDELYNVLLAKFSYYIKNPQLTLNLVDSRPFIVYITGAVINPGSYELNTSTEKSEYLTNIRPEIQVSRKTPLLSNILVAAGGLLYNADLEHIQISNSFENTKYEVNLLDLLEKANSAQDLYLMAGDTVYVPSLPTPLAISDEKYKKYASATFSPRTVPVKVFGYVNHPGLIKMDPSESLSLNSAITAAGGYVQDAAYPPKNVYISRVDVSGKLVTRAVNPMSNDVMLMPNDIVYVPDKIRPTAGKAVDYLVRVLNPVNSVANSYNNWALMFNPTRYQVIGK